MALLRLTVLAAALALASAAAECDVCHLHYYHKVRQRYTTKRPLIKIRRFIPPSQSENTAPPPPRKARRLTPPTFPTLP